ncbi:MAG: GTP-binding protein [Promethearchaeota archaeon]|nr:MAG: GTP-binding protein [Candidatus Lokiarchaeota archaeon]
MINSSLLDTLLENFLNQVNDLTAVLVVDADGLIIAQESTKDFDEQIIAAIMAILDQTINKIKKYAETSFGSGTLDTNEFRLFYLELGGDFPVIFVIVTDSYTNIDKYIPYSYLVAEKVSLLINNTNDINVRLPELLENGELRFNSCKSSNKRTKNYILVIGPQKVGKTALVNKYTNNAFIEHYKPTIGLSIVKKELQISKKIQSILYLFDMGGFKAFGKVRKHFYESIDIKTIVLVFDYSKESTLDKINDWFYEVNLFNKQESIQYVLVGNKIDKIDYREEIRKKAENIANEYNCRLYETSALTGQGIDELFMNIAF